MFFGSNCRGAIRAYLKQREDKSTLLWVGDQGDRLGYDGLRSIIVRRAKDAGIVAPSLHDFRRSFALEMLRAGTDIFTLSKLIGYSTIMVLQRYLKQTYQDTEAAHRQAGPVDNSEILGLV